METTLNGIPLRTPARANASGFSNRNRREYPRASSNRILKSQLAAENPDSFAHLSETQARMARAVCRGRDPAPVVLDAQTHFAQVADEFHLHGPCARMFQHVVQRLLRDTIDMQLFLCIERIFHRFESPRESDVTGGCHAVHHRIERAGESDLREMPRAKPVRELASFGNGDGAEPGNLGQLIAHGGFVSIRVESEFGAIFQDEKILTEIAVKFAGDAVAFAFAILEQPGDQLL